MIPKTASTREKITRERKPVAKLGDEQAANGPNARSNNGRRQQPAINALTTETAAQAEEDSDSETDQPLSPRSAGFRRENPHRSLARVEARVTNAPAIGATKHSEIAQRSEANASRSTASSEELQIFAGSWGADGPGEGFQPSVEADSEAEAEADMEGGVEGQVADEGDDEAEKSKETVPQGKKRKQAETGKASRPKKRSRKGKEVEGEEVATNDNEEVEGEEVEEGEEPDVEEIVPEGIRGDKGKGRKFKVPKSALAAFETFLGSITTIVKDATREGVQEAVEKVMSKAGQGQPRARPRAKAAKKEYVKPPEPVCEICWFQFCQRDRKDPLFKCANEGCRKWYHAKCLPAWWKGYICTEADEGCSDRPQQERQQIQEAAEAENRKAAGKANVDEVNPRAKARVQKVIDVDEDGSPLRRVMDRFSKQKCRSLEWKPKEESGCQENYTNKNMPVYCDLEGCKERSFCTNCKNSGKGVLVEGPTDGDDMWFCGEKCRRCYDEQMKDTPPSTDSSSDDQDGEDDGKKKDKGRVSEGEGEGEGGEDKDIEAGDNDDGQDEEQMDQERGREQRNAREDEDNDKNDEDDQTNPEKEAKRVYESCRCKRKFSEQNPLADCTFEGCKGQGWCTACKNKKSKWKGVYRTDGLWFCCKTCHAGWMN
jgi:hypothetical protein